MTSPESDFVVWRCYGGCEDRVARFALKAEAVTYADSRTSGEFPFVFVVRNEGDDA